MKMIVCIGLLALLIPMGVIRSRRGVSENRVDGQLDTDTEVPVDKVAAAARKKGSSKLTLASRDMKAVQFPVTAAGDIELTTKSGLKDVNSHAFTPSGEFTEKDVKMLESVKANKAKADLNMDVAGASAPLDKTKAKSAQAESAMVDTAGASFFVDKAQAMASAIEAVREIAEHDKSEAETSYKQELLAESAASVQLRTYNRTSEENAGICKKGEAPSEPMIRCYHPGEICWHQDALLSEKKHRFPVFLCGADARYLSLYFKSNDHFHKALSRSRDYAYYGPMGSGKKNLGYVAASWDAESSKYKGFQIRGCCIYNPEDQQWRPAGKDDKAGDQAIAELTVTKCEPPMEGNTPGKVCYPGFDHSIPSLFLAKEWSHCLTIRNFPTSDPRPIPGISQMSGRRWFPEGVCGDLGNYIYLRSPDRFKDLRPVFQANIMQPSSPVPASVAGLSKGKFEKGAFQVDDSIRFAGCCSWDADKKKYVPSTEADSAFTVEKCSLWPNSNKLMTYEQYTNMPETSWAHPKCTDIPRKQAISKLLYLD